MIRVAVVGMGLMGMLHARILQHVRGVHVEAAIDIDHERLSEVERTLGIPTFHSLDEVLGVVDAVSVTLPDHLHVDACCRALRAGKHVLVEKPLATTTEDAGRILGAQMSPNQLMVGHLLRFDLRLLELKRRIDGGALGEIQYFRIHRANTRGGVKRLGGRASVTAFLGVHDIDVMLWLTGASIARVAARGRKVFTGQWDLSVAHMDLSNGALAVVENHWLIHDASSRSCFAGVQVFGSKGTATLDLSTDELELATDDLGMSRRVDSRNWTHDGGLTGGSLRRELEAFIDAIRDGKPMPVSGADGLRAVEALSLIEKALETDGPVTSEAA
jgi:UDP-N-acetylglucosamine 3-dehydrogenase